MYEYLEGDIAGRSAARLCVDVHGVGYDLVVPLGAGFPASGRVRVWTHLSVREDSHTLYGFPDREARDLFRLLLTARGVGPVMAIGILSGLARGPLLDAIVTGDTKTLTRIKGVGKKTADQILLDLSDKAATLRAELAAQSSGAIAPAGSRNPHLDDAVAALVSIGYSDKEAKKSVEKAAQKVDGADLELLVRTALSS